MLLWNAVSDFRDAQKIMLLLHCGVRGHDLPQRELVGFSRQTFKGEGVGHACHVWAKPGCLTYVFPTYYALPSWSIYWIGKNIKLRPFQSFLGLSCFLVSIHTSACNKISDLMSPSVKTGPDLSMAWADSPLCLRAAGTEATDGFPAGDPGQRKRDTENRSGQRGDAGWPGRAWAGLPGDPEWSSAMCGCGRQADRAAGDAGEGEAEGQVFETLRCDNNGVLKLTD